MELGLRMYGNMYVKLTHQEDHDPAPTATTTHTTEDVTMLELPEEEKKEEKEVAEKTPSACSSWKDEVPLPPGSTVPEGLEVEPLLSLLTTRQKLNII
jgi:hypothetical protein